MIIKRSIIYSHLLNKKHRYYNQFTSISQSFGYEVLKTNGEKKTIQHIEESGSCALFCDEDLYHESLQKKVESISDRDKSLAIVLIIKELSSKMGGYDKKVDNYLIFSLPENVFALSLFNIFKYVWMKEELKAVSGITNPEFIKKLLSKTAHAINNILAGMQGYSELAQLHPEDKRLIQDSFEVVIDSSHRVRNEIKNLRAFARIENPQFNCVNIVDVLNESVNLAATQIKVKGIELIKDIEYGFLVNGDYDQLVQVFFNLLNDIANNSREKSIINLTLSSEAGKGVLEIQGKEYEVDEDDFRSLERVFAFNRPFLKMESKEGKIDNLNVLSICNRIIHNHNGDIFLNRRGKTKLVYIVKIPVLKEASYISEIDQTRTKQVYDTIENLDLDILVVDDEEYVRNTIYYFFDKKGCRVTLAEDGEFGLKTARKKPFDLIFMDYLMPKMGGIEAARKIRKSNKEVKIVFITGKDTLNEDELYKSGVYAFIRKPFQIRDLYTIANKVALENGIIE